MKNQQYSISRRGLYTGLFLLILLMSTGISGCSDETTTTSSTPESSGMEPDSQESSSDSVQEVDATGIDEPLECKEDTDCDGDNSCRSSGTCDEGTCVYVQQPSGTACGSFCAPGVCSEKGNCELQVPFDCPDLDGNLCTLPTCDVELDECVETPLPDGAPPYASTECYENPVCIDGAPDFSQADLTEQGKGCEQMNAGLDPQGCIESYECVGGDVGCEPVFLPTHS